MQTVKNTNKELFDKAVKQIATTYERDGKEAAAALFHRVIKELDLKLYQALVLKERVFRVLDT